MKVRVMLLISTTCPSLIPSLPSLAWYVCITVVFTPLHAGTDVQNAAVGNPRYVPPPHGDTAASQSDVTTAEIISVTSGSHDGDEMSFDDSSSALPGDSISREVPLALPDGTENGHLVIAGGSNGVTSGQLEGHKGQVKTTKVLLTLESKGLHRRSIAQMKNSVSPDIRFHWQQQQW